MKEKSTHARWLPKMTRRRFFTSAGAAAAVATTGLGGLAAADDLAPWMKTIPRRKR